MTQQIADASARLRAQLAHRHITLPSGRYITPDDPSAANTHSTVALLRLLD